MTEFLNFSHFRSLVTLAHLFRWVFKFASIPPSDLEGILRCDNKQTMTRIIHAETRDHYQRVRKLFQHYADFLGLDLEFQGFRQELANLPGDYSAPQGCILMAVGAE